MFGTRGARGSRERGRTIARELSAASTSKVPVPRAAVVAIAANVAVAASLAIAGAVTAAAAPTAPLAPQAAPAPGAPSTDAPAPELIPLPVRLERRAGAFRLDERTEIVAPAAARRTAELLQESLRASTGLPLALRLGAPARTSRDRIVLRLDPREEGLGPEGYRLETSTSGVAIVAPAPAGLFHGTQTLRQLLPAASLRRSRVDGVAWTVPAVSITDYPRFSWRGSHLDVGRHFMPRGFLLSHLDLMALHKLNVFHWHLTDDQGWRLAIEGYPCLTEIGAFRRESQLGREPWEGDGTPHGGFYTQDDVREVVRYAAERFITVVPEIEMPGHAQAAVAAYPWLGNGTGPVEVWTRWGISESVLNVDERTFGFLEEVLTQVLALFPSPFVHTGGDEVPKKEWKESPRVQARMKELGLANEEELQAWFTRRIASFLESKGRRLVGWDEILEGGPLAPGAVVMSWRGEAGGIAAARAGHDVVMAPTDFTYLDYYQSRDPGEPLAIGGFVPVEKVYLFEPVPKELTPDEARHVLGAQAQLWTEYLPAPRDVEYMAWPRLAALAEVVWSPRESRSWDGFAERLREHARRLEALDVRTGPIPGVPRPR